MRLVKCFHLELKTTKYYGGKEEKGQRHNKKLKKEQGRHKMEMIETDCKLRTLDVCRP